jgi:lipopolysaccharide transport system permease protein
MDGHGTGPSTRPPRKHKPLQPLLNIVDGKPVVERMGPLAGFLRFLAEPFTSAWRHRDLIIAPLLSLITYTAFFGGSIKLPNNATSNSSVDYGLFIFGGLIAYNFFSEMAYRAPSLLHEYSHYIKQTMFPAEMLAIISTLRATTYAAIALVLMLACQLVFTGSLHWTVLLLPLWFIPFLAFLIGLTWLLSAMGAFTRDTSYLMMTIAPLMMFATPVFFAQESLSPTMSLVLYANILTGYIEIIRDIVVFGQVPAPLVCLWTLFLSGLTFWFGYWFFCKRRDGIADVI